MFNSEPDDTVGCSKNFRGKIIANTALPKNLKAKKFV